MSHEHTSRMPKPISFLFENSIFLIAGALVALVWANVDHSMGTHTYQSFVNFEFSEIFDGGHSEHATAPTTASPSSEAVGQGDHGHTFNMAFLINDILMAFFFAIAAKEVWEALLPGGPLSNFKRAATPLFATVGGILGPVAIYLTGTFLTGRWDTLGGGWAVPCATDIAFSYLIARMIFGAKHPAIAFLLLLAIADDAAGLMILALFYPQSPLEGLGSGKTFEEFRQELDTERIVPKMFERVGSNVASGHERWQETKTAMKRQHSPPKTRAVQYVVNDERHIVHHFHDNGGADSLPLDLLG